VKNVLLEAVLVGAAGLALAFASNALSPRGLKLTRNYSPGNALAAAAASRSAADPSGSEAKILEDQLRAEGLQLADANKAAKLFADPKRGQDLVIFVDARDDDHYQAGHIPGAYQLDHYHPERYLATVMPACQVAQTIVVYCKGGSCEDSEQTALFLRDSAVPKHKLFVYTGGFDEWSSSHQPIELGERNSGQIPAGTAPASAPGSTR
jgi:rhodanese-related sulfurtransferase